MERLNLRLNSFRKALQTLESICNEEFTVIIRDATIQRFEYTFEAMWKTVKIYLEETEGIICNSPKACFREFMKATDIKSSDTELLLEMTDMRNLTSHTYIEEIAQDIYAKILKVYVSLIKKVFSIILDSENRSNL